jgi:hypothetical protein
MSKKSIDERLKAHPILQGRIKAILEIVEDSAGEVERADEAERRMIEEVRQLGNEALHGWAERKVGEQEGAMLGQGEGVKRNGKKTLLVHNVWPDRGS